MVRVALMLALASCGSKKPDRPAAISDEMVAVMDRDVGVVRKVAAALDAARGDCKQAAQVVRDNTVAIATAARESRNYRALAKDDEAVKAWINATYRTKENLAAEATLQKVARQCATDPHYQAAMAQQQAAVSSP